MNRKNLLLRRIKLLTAFFIFGLFISGVTAIPLVGEVNLLVNILGVDGVSNGSATSELVSWLLRVQEGLQASQNRYPFLFYGTDWLAFGHIIIGMTFIGALMDPMRNKWLFTFGIMACVMVIPFALCFGALRGIPFWWRLIDCSFGVFGFVPVWFCKKWADELENMNDVSGIGPQ